MYQQHHCSELEILTQVGEERKAKALAEWMLGTK